MEPKSPENAEQKRIDLVSKIKSGNAVTLSINTKRLDSFLEAASATDFKVEKIADEGEEFPYPGKYENERRETKDGKSYYGQFQRSVLNIRVGKEGYIAVSIEKPEGSKDDHTPFWESLKKLEGNLKK